MVYGFKAQFVNMFWLVAEGDRLGTGLHVEGGLTIIGSQSPLQLEDKSH
jgi:hypothetical protein